MGSRSCSARWVGWGLVLWLACGVPTGASGQTVPLRPDEVPLADILEVLLVDRDLVAVDARSGGQLTLRLRLGENVVWMGSRGSVGVAFTDQRILAVAADTDAWQRIERFQAEILPDQALLGDRVALIITSRRILGFSGPVGRFLESRLILHERVLAPRTGKNVAVAITDRRALGMSPQAGGFFETPIQLKERLESVRAASNLATVTTNRRLLIFRGPFGSWEERRRELR